MSHMPIQSLAAVELKNKLCLQRTLHTKLGQIISRFAAEKCCTVSRHLHVLEMEKLAAEKIGT
jgi:hypothetical protein